MLSDLASWRLPDSLGRENFLLAVLSGTRTECQYPPDRHSEIKLAIGEAWAWLEGQALLLENPDCFSPNVLRILSRRAKLLAEESDERRLLPARRLAKETIHPTIREDVWALFHRGKYDTAVFEAMKAVEIAVREAADLSAADIGTPLMRKAFELDSGPLTDKTMERGERQARSDMFAGAIGSYKNPHSHRNVALDDPDEAAEIIMLANHLLRIVDTRRNTPQETTPIIASIGKHA